MKNKKINVVIASLACLIPTLVGLLLATKLPEMLPSHFDLNGNADNYMNKYIMIFGLPLFLGAITLLVGFMLKNDPKNTNHPSIITNLAFIFLPVISNVTVNASYLLALGYDFNIAYIILPLLGIIFILVGNYLPKVKQNYTVGVRLPWTLNDEENWNKTHRFTGLVWVIGGFIFFVVPFFTPLLFINIFVLLIVPIAYSYILYKKKRRA